MGGRAACYNVGMPAGFDILRTLRRALERQARRKAIEGCIRRLAPRLRADYQHGSPYTPDQVSATLGRGRPLSAAQIAYAQAIFCEPGADESARVLRREVAQTCFERDDFRPTAIDRYFGRLKPTQGYDGYEWSGSISAGEAWGGGHDGGGGHGGHGGDGGH